MIAMPFVALLLANCGARDHLISAPFGFVYPIAFSHCLALVRTLAYHEIVRYIKYAAGVYPRGSTLVFGNFASSPPGRSGISLISRKFPGNSGKFPIEFL